MYGVSTVWKETGDCAKQYLCALDIYFMTVPISSISPLKYFFSVASVHVKNSVDGINATEKKYLRGEMELMGKLGSNNTTNTRMLPSASKDVSIKFSD